MKETRGNELLGTVFRPKAGPQMKTPYPKTCACSQTEGPARRTTLTPGHGCLSTAHSTDHMNNEHSLQFQSYNSCTEQMWHRLFFVCNVFVFKPESLSADFLSTHKQKHISVHAFEPILRGTSSHQSPLCFLCDRVIMFRTRLYSGDKSAHTQNVEHNVFSRRACARPGDASPAGWDQPSVSHVRSPMHGWLHREQRCGVKTKDYRKPSIILSKPEPRSATFLFSFPPHHQPTAVSFFCTCEQVEKQIRPERKQVDMDEYGSCSARWSWSVSLQAPETCFNSCVCVFGGALPQGNIFPFYCFK